MTTPGIWFKGQRSQSWQGISLVGITYIYFLIFAQFGFLHRLADLGLGVESLRIVMGSMALGGISASLAVAPFEAFASARRRMQGALVGCSIAAALSMLPLGIWGAAAVAVAIGVSLGVLTVTLVTHLRGWVSTRRPFLSTGLGVGSAYFICNYQPFFLANARAVAEICAVLCLVGVAIVEFAAPSTKEQNPENRYPNLPPVVLIVAMFAALVWLDSAGFFIIQNTRELKAGTWSGIQPLWRIGGVHFLAAIVGAELLPLIGLWLVLVIAFVLLASACLLLAIPGLVPLAALAYPAGVSLYSVALVAYPALLANASTDQSRAKVAGAVFAVAGWLGSALGIGMAENLRRVPTLFVVVASVFFAAPLAVWLWRRRRQEAVSLLALCGLAWEGTRLLTPSRDHQEGIGLVELGRRVYISEGCIHCHSQFIRPNSQDEVFWGKATRDRDDARRSEQPPLIGNRRQGPDLSSVGGRRSEAWLEAHFRAPDAVSFRSPMPSYAHLFQDGRGPALLAYVESLTPRNKALLNGRQIGWHPLQPTSTPSTRAAVLLVQHCRTCHAPDGVMRQLVGKNLRRTAPDFMGGPFIYVPMSANTAWRTERIARIIKFGLPGTEMPGHEYLPDDDVLAMAAEVERLSSRRPL